MNELPDNDSSHVYDRAFLLHGAKRNAVLSLAEIEQYGLDNFADADYISIYGMAPHEWYRHAVRLLGRTAVECTRDALGNLIGLDVASVATRMSAGRLLVLDLFAGSCNTLFWILRHLPNSDGIAFESDPQVFELTHRNLSALNQKIDLVYGDFARLLEELRVQEDRGIIAFVAPPWGAALDEVKGLDLGRTTPPSSRLLTKLRTDSRSIRCSSRRRFMRTLAHLPWTRLGRTSTGRHCGSTTSTREAGTTALFWERKVGPPGKRRGNPATRS
jgi:RNA cap guanine-N2 methyltransferase